MYSRGPQNAFCLHALCRPDERAYRLAFLEQDTKTATILISAALLMDLFWVRFDYLHLEGQQLLFGFVALRVLFALFSGYTIIRIQRNHVSARRLDQWIFVWAIACVVLIMVTVPILPAAYTGHIPLDLCTVLGLYALQAGPLLWRATPPLLLSLYEITIMINSHGPFASLDSVAGITAFLIAHTIGWTVTSNWHRYRKTSFYARQELEQLYQDAEQQRLEAEASSRTLERILDTSPNLVLIIDLDFEIIRANKTAADHFHSKKKQLVGESCYQIFGLPRKLFELYLNEAISSSIQPQNFEVFIPSLSLDSHVYAAPLLDKTGKHEATLVVVQNISSWKQAEKALKAAQEQYRSLVENCHGHIYTITPNGYITFASPRIQDWLGFLPQHFLGKHFREVVYAEDIPRCEAFHREILEQELAPRGLEYRIMHRDGSVRWHLSNFIPCFQADGQIEHFVGHAIDITEQKEHHAALKGAREKAEAANDAKSAFLALISHEIRTPLHTIVGFSGLARKCTDTDEFHQYIEILDRSAHQLMDLVNDLLDMSKVEAGQLTIDATPFNLHEILELLHWQFKPMAAKKAHVEFHVHKSDNLPTWILGDPIRFRQIVTNLVGNALKFTEEGMVSLTVMMQNQDEISTEENLLLLKIEDTGIGIDESRQDLLFRPFQQIEQKISRKYGGTGLGLAIVRHLVQLMGGKVEVTSRLGQGSCFTVQLPCHPCLAPRYKQLSLASHPSLSMLVVEDNSFNRVLLEKTLSNLGHSVTATATALEALNAMKSQRYDCILLDVWMPDRDGIELAKHIRAMESSSRIAPTPIIAYSADADVQTREQCLAAGIQMVLLKPLNQQKLIEAIYQQCFSPGAAEMLKSEHVQPAECEHFALNSQILADLNHEEELIANYAELLWEDIEEELYKLDQALTRTDRELLLAVAHSLKGLCVYLAEPQAGNIAISLHQGAMERPFSELTALAQQLRLVCLNLRPSFSTACTA